MTELFGEDTLLRYRWPVLYTALAVIGLILLFRRQRVVAVVLLGPFAAAVAAAVAQQYPFRARLVLYVAPGLVLAVAQAAEGIRRVASRLHPALGAACMAAIFVGPAWSLVRFPPPYFVEDHKTVLAYVRDHRQPGDAVYVYSYEIEAIERYGAEYGLAPGDYEIGRCSKVDRRMALREADRYRGRPRVWVIAGAVPPFQPPRQTLEQYLSTIGVPRASIVVEGMRPIAPVSATLFDLSDPKRLEAATAETFPLVTAARRLSDGVPAQLRRVGRAVVTRRRTTLRASRLSPRAPFLCRPPSLWALVAIGAALRIFQYASDTSLWYDELSIVRNLVHRSAASLATEPLRYDQVAPVGFILAEKGISRVLGESDLAFRFLLLPVGLAALVHVPLSRAAAARRLRRALRGRDVRDRRSFHPLQRRGQVVRHRHGGGHRDVARDAAAA